MFKSELTGKQYGPGIKPQRVVVATRPRHYVNEIRKLEGKRWVKYYIESDGTEIVKELLIGPDERIADEQPTQET